MGATVIPKVVIKKWAVHATVSDSNSGRRIKILSEEVDAVYGRIPMMVMERIRSLRAALDPKDHLPMYVEGDDDAAVEIENYLLDQVASDRVADAMWSFTTSSGARVSGFVTNNI